MFGIIYIPLINNRLWRLFLFLSLAFFSTGLFATHNRAGEITYEQIDDLTIRITVTTYTKTSSTAADRDSLEIFWGDGTSEFVTRSNGNGDPLPNDVKINKYIAEHTYPGRATFTIYFVDPNRVGNILNVNPPNSIEIPFFLSTTFTFLDPQFQGFNNSATLLQPPLDFGCVGRPFVHNPNAFDVDGDSLSFELIVPLEDVDQPVPNYFYPDDIGQSTTNTINLDPITGTFTWDSPTIPGEYNIAFRINEYREGVLINSIIRDMQILVRDCENQPPTIDAIEEICVIAGTVLDIPIIVDDPDVGQLVSVSATGGPFEIDNPAEFVGPIGYTSVPFEERLRWETNCNHISDSYYQIVIRAVDNYFADSTGLATLKTLRIKVLGPPPENISGESINGKLRIEWELPYNCEDTEDDYFQGFSVWRKINSTTLPVDSCFSGLEGLGYRKVKFITKENNGQRYFFEDENVEPNQIYCYRVLAEFARFTNTGNPFNRVESIASDEICLLLKRDLPFITEASVISTNEASGVNRISWAKPDPEDLDTLLNPGPYSYQLQFFDDQDWVSIPDARFTTINFADSVVLSYLHMGLNTVGRSHRYRVEFLTSNSTYGTSAQASTLFLNASPNDQEVNLSWTDETPWNNYNYRILRRFENGPFEEIGNTDQLTFTDTDLNNGTEYCYIIESEGSYRIPDIISPIFNNSQFVCATPTDLRAPCAPIIEVTNDCDEDSSGPVNAELGNTIRWFIDESCSSLADVSRFNIYYALADGNYENIFTANANMINEYFDQPDIGVAGCYIVTALDSLGNESEPSNEICLENCPNYVLPNTFTPNDDGANDFFVPRVNRFIARIEMEIFNGWGNKVFETQDPAINWNGTNLGGAELNDGVYYYICKVFEINSEGNEVEVQKLKGHINLLR